MDRNDTTDNPYASSLSSDDSGRARASIWRKAIGVVAFAAAALVAIIFGKGVFVIGQAMIDGRVAFVPWWLWGVTVSFGTMTLGFIWSGIRFFGDRSADESQPRAWQIFAVSATVLCAAFVKLVYFRYR